MYQTGILILVKIKYMFPKAHAAAYVLMAVRIAYFKVHHALLYYAAYFTVRADDFDIETMTKGSNAIRAVMDDINSKGLDASPKEKNLLTVLELALEMCERGYHFKKLTSTAQVQRSLSLMETV